MTHYMSVDTTRQNMSVETTRQNMSGDMMHPRRNMSLSIPQGDGRDEFLIDTEAAQTFQLDEDQTRLISGSETSLNYIGQNKCIAPVLPPNTSITFPSHLIGDISTMENFNKSNVERATSQRLIERYLAEQGSCSRLNPDVVRDFRLRLFNIDGDTLDSVLATEEALNANIHDDISCVVDAIIYDGKMPGNFSPSRRERIRNWFPTIKQIGPDSIEGYALKTSFTSDGDLFVIKAPRNPRNDELVHEAVVGFYGLNKLRHILPNYMYVYGYTKCSPPAIRNREVATWCSTSDPAVSYLITENIRNSVSIGEFITNPNTSAIDFMIVFYQLQNALNLAYKIYGYTHYDLHYGNIMVRKYNKEVAIPYFGTGDKIIGYISSRYVPYIIDYGYSRITIGGIGFGKIGLESGGIEGKRPFPMYDTYKIIGFLGEAIYTKSFTGPYNYISDILEKLFSFFGDGTLRDRVEKKLSSGNDWYGAKEIYRSITHDDYISWLQNNSGLVIPVHVNLLKLMSRGVYTAPINTSMDTCQFYNMVTSGDGPETSLEYCEVIAAINEDTILSDDLKQSSVSWLNSRFNAETYFLTTEPHIINNIQEIIAMVQSHSPETNIIPDISGINISIRSIVKVYRDRIFELLEIKDKISNLISYIKASICSLANQGKYQNYKSNIDKLINISNIWSTYIDDQRTILKQNVNHVKSVDWNSVSSDKNILSFWRKEHGNLVLAV